VIRMWCLVYPLSKPVMLVHFEGLTNFASFFKWVVEFFCMVKFLSELQNLMVVLQVTKTLPWEHIQDSHIMRAKQAFIGDIMQVPPMFSAIKVGGERLYKKARRGEEISVPPRPVTIYDFRLERNLDNRSYLIYLMMMMGVLDVFFPFQFSQTASRRV
jgi:tRNA pseudouridine55 synthase